MTDQPLFPYRRTKRAKAPKDPAVGQALTRLMLRVYTPLYRARFGQPPMLGTRDWGLLKSLLGTYGEETVEQYIRWFMAWPGDDWFAQHQGWTMGGLKFQWNKITAVLKQSSTSTARLTVPCQHHPPCVDNGAHSRRVFEERELRKA